MLKRLISLSTLAMVAIPVVSFAATITSGVAVTSVQFSADYDSAEVVLSKALPYATIRYDLYKNGEIRRSGATPADQQTIVNFGGFRDDFLLEGGDGQYTLGFQVCEHGADRLDIDKYCSEKEMVTVDFISSPQSAAKYTDYRSMTPEEKAAVSVLTDLRVVQGYPDGSFAPRQKLNRVEFLKIVLLAQLGDHFWPQGLSCFPDVPSTEWYAQYVCYAKNSNFVQGYPDDTFHPTQTVNYAEAVKMLVNLFNYRIAPVRGEEWYASYLRAAEGQGVALAENPQPSALLTRGQMARLVAAFHAKGIMPAQ